MAAKDPIAIKLEEEDVRRLSKDRGEPDWLLEKRLESFTEFRGLPVETSEIFRKYADVAESTGRRSASPETRRRKSPKPSASRPKRILLISCRSTG